MVKILLLSDTHSYLDERMIFYINQADEVWHAGDIGNPEVYKSINKLKPTRAVYGNIDSQTLYAELPKIAKFKIEKCDVIMTHIGGYPNHYAVGIKAILEQHKPHLFISGHSHILRVMYDKNLKILHINPGAAGKEGFHQIRTMVRFEINESDIKNLEVIELEKRD